MARNRLTRKQLDRLLGIPLDELVEPKRKPVQLWFEFSVNVNTPCADVHRRAEQGSIEHMDLRRVRLNDDIHVETCVYCQQWLYDNPEIGDGDDCW